MSLLGCLRPLVRCTSGAAALEAAMVIPVAIVLMAGGVEFGRLFTLYGTAAKSVRDATRYLARVPQANICDNWALNNAKNLAVYGTLDSTNANPLIPGWAPENVCTSLKPCMNTVGGLLTLVSPSCPPANANAERDQEHPVQPEMCEGTGTNSETDGSTDPMAEEAVPCLYQEHYRRLGGAHNYTSFITIELSAAVPYTRIMFGAIGLSNSWAINVKHQERSIGE